MMSWGNLRASRLDDPYSDEITPTRPSGPTIAVAIASAAWVFPCFEQPQKQTRAHRLNFCAGLICSVIATILLWKSFFQPFPALTWYWLKEYMETHTELVCLLIVEKGWGFGWDAF